MARPTNKEELILLGNKNFEIFFDMVNLFTDVEKKSEFIFDNSRDKNIRDILVHLHHWHLMMMDWYKIGMSGKKPEMPAKGYTWKTTPELNKSIWLMYQETDYETAVLLLNKSFNNLQNIIKSHTDNDLFEKKKYKWTGTTSLGAYLISATSSHYDWATKLLKQYKKYLSK